MKIVKLDANSKNDLLSRNKSNSFLNNNYSNNVKINPNYANKTESNEINKKNNNNKNRSFIVRNRSLNQFNKLKKIIINKNNVIK